MSAQAHDPRPPAQPRHAPHCATGALPSPSPGGCLDSTDILRGQKTVAISHNGSTCRLQATRLGKLILTK